ncbi:hypothetical protein NDU88_000846 [Pleurodeles waltl]|uniref:Uncharacterized protein n=1 Tax=Pleurodeles waltl TaxID=8319 RepID=A0AAV7Q4A7_PLEWA|nr:hypothetical protein NDU88_000846 [Pleurodeles waltl]
MEATRTQAEKLQAEDERPSVAPSVDGGERDTRQTEESTWTITRGGERSARALRKRALEWRDRSNGRGLRGRRVTRTWPFVFLTDTHCGCAGGWGPRAQRRERHRLFSTSERLGYGSGSSRFSACVPDTIFVSTENRHILKVDSCITQLLLKRPA